MTETPPSQRAEQAGIDASTKVPVAVLLVCALLWLVSGSALQILASIQAHSPAFLSNCEWFTFGRVYPAAQNALIYGWGFNAAFAVSLWLMARLSCAALRHGGWLVAAAVFWNVGVKLGMLGILTGASTSVALLEMPRFAVLLLLVAYSMVAVWGVANFSQRNTGHAYASQWYLLGAAFWFPWLYILAQGMLFVAPARGVMQAIVGEWYVQGLYGLFFIPVALSSAYYFVPKILGQPIRHYFLAPAGFWWLVTVLPLLGGSRLVGAPVPVWVPTTGVAAGFLLLVGLLAVGLNLFGTVAGSFDRVRASTTLSFVVAGVAFFLLWGVLQCATALRSVAAHLPLTLAREGQDWLLFYGVFSMAMFGAIYFLLPRLLLRAWPSAMLVWTHWVAAALGVLMVAGVLILGGWRQGELLNNPAVPFTEVAQAVSAWLAARSVGLMLLAIGHIAFLLNLGWMLCAGRAANAGGLIPPPAELPLAKEPRWQESQT
ncbi:MAG: cbb3-type cytochrome c oxidase subunit I [Opitutaceae bacterium]|nr:cbb3-type cytochrome c oxidase subunit I [Opitutaceae bacterium]